MCTLNFQLFWVNRKEYDGILQEKYAYLVVNCQTVFQSAYTILFSYQKCMGGRYSLPELVIFLFFPLHYIYAEVKERKVKVKVAQSCPTLSDPTDYIVHGILQARTLEWVAFPFSRGSSQTRDGTQGWNPGLPCCTTDSLPAEPQGKPKSKVPTGWSAPDL